MSGRMVLRGDYDRNRNLSPGQFEMFGPMWQAECHWCGDLSDAFDTYAERADWAATHRCRVVADESEGAA